MKDYWALASFVVIGPILVVAGLLPVFSGRTPHGWVVGAGVAFAIAGVLFVRAARVAPVGFRAATFRPRLAELRWFLAAVAFLVLAVVLLVH